MSAEAKEYHDKWIKDEKDLRSRYEVMESYAREYHAKEMQRKLEEADLIIINKYPTRDGKLCYNEARLEACKELLTHLKEPKTKEL